jgi:hypothetical protein
MRGGAGRIPRRRFAAALVPCRAGASRRRWCHAAPALRGGAGAMPRRRFAAALDAFSRHWY